MSRNIAVTGGGGISTGVGCTVSNCTITDNSLTDPTTTRSGGGLQCGGAPVLEDLVIHDNTPSDCSSDCLCQ